MTENELNDNGRNEAIFHIVSSTKQWADTFVFPLELGLEKAFKDAIEHVKYYHYPELTKEDIKLARHKLKL